MNKTVYTIMGVVIVVSLYFVLRPNSVKVESFVIRPQDFVETLSIEGKVRSKTKHVVYAFANGNIENLNVKLGDSVKQDQVVTKLIWDVERSVKSPMDGVVSKIYRDSSGPIQRGDPIFEVSRLSDLEVVAELQTPDVLRLQERGDVMISNWGGDKDLRGKITHINRVGIVKTSALGVEEERAEVRIDFQEIPDDIKNRLGDTYHVDILFILSRESNVLTVPLGALFKNKDSWAVYEVVDGRVHLKDIEIQKKNDQVAVVKSGLVAGDRILLFPNDKIREGQRVQIPSN